MNANFRPIEETEASIAHDLNLDRRCEIDRPGREHCPEMPYHAFTGEVVSGSTWSETHVSGGGTTIVGAGRFAAGSTAPIRSTVVNQTEFWVRRSDGQEVQFCVAQGSAIFRAGHTVTVIYLIDNGVVKVQQIFNHSTEVLQVVSKGALGSFHGALILGGFPANAIAILMLNVGMSGQADVAGHFALGIALLLGNAYYIWLAMTVSRYGRAAGVVANWIKANRFDPAI